MADRDPDHWLYRLSAEEWLRAAAAELGRADEALAKKQQRAGVTQARRAAGMAWNAVLVVTGDETGYGRSYMEHLQALARDEGAPVEIREAARALVGAPLQSEVVSLGRGDTRLARAAELLARHAAELVERRRSPS